MQKVLKNANNSTKMQKNCKQNCNKTAKIVKKCNKFTKNRKTI